VRVGRYEIILHWGNSFACEFITGMLLCGIYKDEQDIFIKLGRLVIIVSDITKVKQLHRGVQKA
jgi:hypothetical protein